MLVYRIFINSILNFALDHSYLMHNTFIVDNIIKRLSVRRLLDKLLNSRPVGLIVEIIDIAFQSVKIS